jgi:hypothetical protein
MTLVVPSAAEDNPAALSKVAGANHLARLSADDARTTVTATETHPPPSFNRHSFNYFAQQVALEFARTTFVASCWATSCSPN